MPAVSVVIVTYNSGSTLRRCLDALLHQSFGDFEVVVYDNASKDDSLSIAREFAGRLLIKIVEGEANHGFAGGNNRALDYCRAPLIALLNPDAYANEQWIERLVDEMESSPEVGICASCMVVAGTEEVDSAGDNYSRLLKGIKRGEGRPYSEFTEPVRVFAACGGALLARRSMIDEIGLFDERFFLIAEDVDFSFRAQLAGYEVQYVPEAVVQHEVSRTIGVMSELQAYHALRNNALVRMKNVPAKIMFRCLPAHALLLAVEFFFYIFRHRMAKVYFRAYCDAFRLLPAMLSSRAGIMQRRRKDDGYIYRMMSPAFDPAMIGRKWRKLIGA